MCITRPVTGTMGTTRANVAEVGFYLCLLVAHILMALAIFLPILGVMLLFWFAFGIALPNPFGSRETQSTVSIAN